MKITKEFLTERIAGMTQQLEQATSVVSQLRGAIMDCRELMTYLETPEPEEESEEGIMTLDELKDALGAEEVEEVLDV